VNKVWFYCTLC